MATYFEITNVTTCEQLHEWARVVYSKNVRRSVIIYSVYALVLLAMWLWNRNVVALVGLGVMIFLIIRNLMFPKKQANMAYKRKLAYYDGVMPPAVFSFYEDHFEVVDVDSSRTAHYAKIQTVEFLEYSFAITLMDGHAYLAATDGFTKGTPEEFREFIRNKCPHLNLPQWQW